MFKFLLYCSILLLLGGIVYFNLTPEGKVKIGEETVDQITDNPAQQMVNSIRKPIEKAQALREHEESRMEEMDDLINRNTK